MECQNPFKKTLITLKFVTRLFTTATGRVSNHSVLVIHFQYAFISYLPPTIVCWATKTIVASNQSKKM